MTRVRFVALLLLVAGCEAAPTPAPSVSKTRPPADSGIAMPAPTPAPAKPDPRPSERLAAEREDEARRVLGELLQRQQAGPPQPASRRTPIAAAPPTPEASEADLEEARAALSSIREVVRLLGPTILTSEKFQKAVTNVLSESERVPSP